MNLYLIITLATAPIIAGIVYSTMLSIPVIGAILTYLLPIALMYVWFKFGYYLATVRKLNFWYWLLITHGSGIILLLLHLLEFYLLSSQQRPLVFISRLFVITFTPLFSRIGMVFEPILNETTRITETFIQCGGLLFMILLFVSGYLTNKRVQRLQENRQENKTE